jgi:DNA protecting protein DprA
MAELTENLIRLKTASGVGNAIVWRLLRTLGNADRVLGARESELLAVKGVTREKAAAILTAAASDPRPEMECAVEAGVDIIPYDDPGYPQALLHSFDPPVVLYVRGTLTRDDQVAVGMVGTRRASPYGRQYALDFSAALARGGYTIVSGLARGIDTFAHIGALNARGRTVGVLGCGFNHMYPEENRDLALEMTKSGAVVTEFPMNTPPSRDTFPIRNRIIAGMSLGLVVIEAPLRSGSLITARLANEIGRTVFAVPGRVGDAASEGCNKLIRDGASMATSADDIFHELNPQLPLPKLPARPAPSSKRSGKTEQAPPLFAGDTTATAAESRPGPGRSAPPVKDENARRLLAAMDAEWRTLDAIAETSGVPVGQALSLMAGLAMRGLVEQRPGQMFRRTGA